MQSALTLVHKGAIDIATHSIYSFARHFGKTHRLQIHSDGSLDTWDIELLLKAAIGLEIEIIMPKERQEVVAKHLLPYPKTKLLLEKGGYFTKLELPIYHDEPYFYFDSDVIWLRPVNNLIPATGSCAFSTEGWSWYFGICRDSLWIRGKTPRRVNSGFYYLSNSFPFEKMEEMLENQMFDPSIQGNSDQEIMAYLYPEMVTYDQEDVKRSRVGKIYDLSTLESVALHFPGRMWKQHMDQIEKLASLPPRSPQSIRFCSAKKLTHLELFRMRTYMALANSIAARVPIKLLRRLRKSIGPA